MPALALVRERRARGARRRRRRAPRRRDRASASAASSLARSSRRCRSTTSVSVRAPFDAALLTAPSASKRPSRRRCPSPSSPAPVLARVPRARSAPSARGGRAPPVQVASTSSARSRCERHALYRGTTRSSPPRGRHLCAASRVLRPKPPTPASIDFLRDLAQPACRAPPHAHLAGTQVRCPSPSVARLLDREPPRSPREWSCPRRGRHAVSRPSRRVSCERGGSRGCSSTHTAGRASGALRAGGPTAVRDARCVLSSSAGNQRSGFDGGCERRRLGKRKVHKMT